MPITRGAQLVGELGRDRPDATRGAADQDGLARLEVGVVEQALPGGQPGDGHGGRHGVVDVGRERGPAVPSVEADLL